MRGSPDRARGLAYGAALAVLLVLQILPATAGAQGRVLDLNSASSVQLQELQGIGPVKAEAILRYRSEHGRFTHPAELLDVPGIGQRTYEGLCRQVEVDGQRGCDDSGRVNARPSNDEPLPSVSDDGRLNVNLASIEELEVLPRIGPALAERIVNYRQTNGLFASVDELDEVPGIGPATLDQMRPFVTTQTNVNSVDAETLERLGATAEMAEAIISRRGRAYYVSLDELTDVPGVDRATVETLRPYLYAEEPLDAD